MLLLLTFVLSLILCLLYWQFALHKNIFAEPNERSSHSRPTPHGGGAAVLLAVMLAVSVGSAGVFAQQSVFLWITAMAFALAILGVLDDLFSLSVKLRFASYALICLFASAFLLSGVGLSSSAGGVSESWMVLPVAFAMLWLLNLYNFMDGIDGLAALETIFVCTAAAGISFFMGGGEAYSQLCLILATAHAGFFVLNFPPAKLFMGDAGSVATGFLIAALVLAGAVQEFLNPLCWLILLGVFIVDATWTLLWRVFTGQAFTQAHRSHAYQRLSRHYGSHLKVDILVMAINLLWLAPFAVAVAFWPQHALFLVILAYVPLVTGMAKIHRLT